MESSIFLVSFTSRLPFPLVFCSSHSGLLSASSTDMLCPFFLLSLYRRFPQFEVPLPAIILPSVHLSICPSITVVFAKRGQGSVVECYLTSWNLHLLPAWRTHPFRLISNVISILRSFPVHPSRFRSLCWPSTFFISVIAFSLFIQDIYCLLCAESKLKARDTLLNKTKIRLIAYVLHCIHSTFTLIRMWVLIGLHIISLYLWYQRC